MSNRVVLLLGADGADIDLVRELDLARAESEYEGYGPIQCDRWSVEIAAHEEHGFYVPTREELMETTGEFFVHLVMERA